jgi:23S rRNA pseudouridine2605 synthase
MNSPKRNRGGFKPREEGTKQKSNFSKRGENKVEQRSSDNRKESFTEKRKFTKSRGDEKSGGSFYSKDGRGEGTKRESDSKKEFNRDKTKDYSSKKPREGGFSSERSAGPRPAAKRSAGGKPNKDYSKGKSDFSNKSDSFGEKDWGTNRKRSFKEVDSVNSDDWAPKNQGRSGSSYKSHKTSNQSNKKSDDGRIRLNRYLANSGICSRREADEFIKAGAVSVNGNIITEMGFKVELGDEVRYGGALISPEKPVYLLLNKPKGFITTVSDPRDRKTVMSLIAGACKERVVPVGRLDRNTTGLLLFTNDGDMLKKLTHPKHGVSKIYHVTTDASIKVSDMQKMMEGVELEDGIAKADQVSYVDVEKNKKEIGIELHSGKNRVVRRMIASLGYEVISLDRVCFAGLTKKNLPRGQYRFLTEKEVNFLKMLS